MTDQTTAEMAAYKWVLDNPHGLDPVCGDNGYPTEIEDQRIRHWFDDQLISRAKIVELMAYIRERWNYSEWGWRETIDKDGHVFYAISTGGWSGNEQLMSALESSWTYRALLFNTERVGGHYILELRLKEEE